MLRSMSQKEYINDIKQWYEDKPNDSLGKLLDNRHGIFYRFLDEQDEEFGYDFDGPCPCCGSEPKI